MTYMSMYILHTDYILSTYIHVHTPKHILSAIQRVVTSFDRPKAYMYSIYIWTHYTLLHMAGAKDG